MPGVKLGALLPAPARRAVPAPSRVSALAGGFSAGVCAEHCFPALLEEQWKTGRGFLSSEHVQMPKLLVLITLQFSLFLGSVV